MRRIEKIETAVEPKFQAAFRRGDGDPAQTAPYPHLSRVVALPTPDIGDEARGRAGRRAERQRQRAQ